MVTYSSVFLDCNIKSLLVTATIFSAFYPFGAETRAWNIPGHMLSGAIAYQILQRENYNYSVRFGEEPLVRNSLQSIRQLRRSAAWRARSYLDRHRET